MILREKIRDRVTRLWWFVLLQGLLVLGLGVYFVISPGATLTIVSVLLGGYWFIQGVLALIGMFSRDPEAPRGLLLAEGIVGLLAGLFVIMHRQFMPATLGLILAAIALLMGIANLAQGVKGAGARAIVIGVINIVFGIILLGHPLVAASLVPVILGVCGMIGGIVAVFLTLRIRKAVKRRNVAARNEHAQQERGVAPDGIKV